jgi:hypothetical protein
MNFPRTQVHAFSAGIFCILYVGLHTCLPFHTNCIQISCQLYLITLNVTNDRY